MDLENQKEFNLVIERFRELKTERQKYIPLWREIQQYVAITNEINSEFDDNRQPSEQKDVFINDPTAFQCVNNAGDYLAGILWGLDAITLKPSRYIKKKYPGVDFSDFYKHATEVVLEQMNATEASFAAVLRSYCYDQFSYATSGIGVFRNKEFDAGQSECCLNFKSFGVWNSCIDEGKNSRVDVVFSVYNWRTHQIIEEFCFSENRFDEEKFKKLPEEIKRAYEEKSFNRRFKIVMGIMPNCDFILRKRGKIGAKFKGYWFLDGGQNCVFHTEYFNEMPIAICRAIKANNQIYGESSGSLSISSIKMLNHIKGSAVDNVEKVNDAPLGVLSGALIKGNVLNRSAGSVTTFNSQATGAGQPIFPISQAGDISAIVSFLIPELKKDIINAYKIDQLLDFNNQTQMTATESSYRMSIRGKSINGLLCQQKAECLEPVVKRAISIIQDCRLFGEDLDRLGESSEEEIAYKNQVIKDKDFIPPEIAQAMRDNCIWYELKFNGELEKLCNTEIYEAIGRFLQYLQAILQIKPELVHAIEDWEFLDLVKTVSNLVNDKLIKSKYKYDEIIEELQKAKQEQEEMQQKLAQAQYIKDVASANKDEVSANAII